MLVDGIHVPLAEPFYRDGALYLRKLEHNVRRYSLSPVSGLVAFAPGGEATTLSDQEAVDCLNTVAESAAKEKVLIAGIERDSVRGALDLAKAAESAGFDVLLIAAPRNWERLTAEWGTAALIVYFRAIADVTSLPVQLYSGTEYSGCELPVDIIGELAQHPNIVGIYDADLTAERHAAIVSATAAKRSALEVTTIFAPVTRRMKKGEKSGAATFVSAESLGGGAAVATVPPPPALKTRSRTVGFQIMGAGSATDIVTHLQAGAAGAMLTLSTCAPQAVYEVYAAFKDGDPALAEEKAARLDRADVLIQHLGPSGVKYSCDLNGYFGGQPRLPRLPLTADNRRSVEEAMRELRS